MHLRTASFALVATVGLIMWTHDALQTRLKMAATHAHFVQAVRWAKQEIKHAGGSDETPRSTGEWISFYHRAIRAAPHGGPAFVVAEDGDAGTGAVGVSATDYGARLVVTRPAYGKLETMRITIAAHRAP